VPVRPLSRTVLNKNGLVSFCSLSDCADGFAPENDLIADTKGNLFGTTVDGGANGEGGTVFKITDSGFVVPPKRPVFAGTPGKVSCHGQSVSALAQQYGGLNNSAAALGFDTVKALQEAIGDFCEA
jgi:uncharacterized repeat protein (TIGR03803 family)